MMQFYYKQAIEPSPTCYKMVQEFVKEVTGESNDLVSCLCEGMFANFDMH